MPHRIILIGFNGAQLLDLAGPASVFDAANSETQTDAYALTLASSAGGEIVTGCGLRLLTVAIDAIDPASVDTLLVAGGNDQVLSAMVADAHLRRWVLMVARHAHRIGSVCAGAFALAEWGLLDGHRVATHWQDADHLAARYPSLRVDKQAIYVNDGHVWTSAGVSTGIDMSLALVEHDLGQAVATNVARSLVLYARRPGHQSQFSTLLDAQGQAGDYAQLIDWMAGHLDQPLSVEALAERAGQSVRSFYRRFTAATRKTPAAFVEALRLERARTLLSDGAMLKQVAAESGFGTPERLTRAFTRAFGVAPSTWRAIHARQGLTSPPPVRI